MTTMLVAAPVRRALTALCLAAIALLSLAGAPAPAAAVAPNCGSTQFLINQTLPNGANWTMCWEERINEGVVFRSIYFTPPGGPQRLVLYSANLAQIHVPYDNNAARFHDLSDYGLGGGNLNNLTGSDCPGGTLLANNGRNVLCRTVGRAGYAFKYYGTQKQANALALFSVSHIGQYNYIPRWEFGDDGSVTPSAGATGKLQLCTSDPKYGWLVNATSCPRGTNHAHNYYWRLDFDLGTATDDRLEQLDFTGSNTSLRPMTAVAGTTETARFTNAGQFRSWRIVDSALKNTDGHPISYELMAEASHLFRGPTWEPWTRNDVYYTQLKTCEKWASHNPTTDGCADNVAGFVNGETVTDAVLWYGLSFHHVPRDEDETHMPTHWSSFQIIPRDMTATNRR